MNRPWFIIGLIIAIEIMVLALIFPGEMSQKAIEKENRMVGRYLGGETQSWINNKASHWYKTTMIDTQLIEKMRLTVIPTEREKRKSKGLENLGDLWFKFLDNRINAFTKVVYQFYARLSLVLLWSPYMLLLLIPALYDGLMSWRIKRTNFGYASPVIHRYSIRGIWVLMGGLLITFLLPVAIHPTVIPSILMVGCVLLGLSMGNMQKRI